MFAFAFAFALAVAVALALALALALAVAVARFTPSSWSEAKDPRICLCPCLCPLPSLPPFQTAAKEPRPARFASVLLKTSGA